MTHYQNYRNKKSLQGSPHTHEHKCCHLCKSSKTYTRIKAEHANGREGVSMKEKAGYGGRTRERATSAGGRTLSSRQSGLRRMMEGGWRRHRQ